MFSQSKRNKVIFISVQKNLCKNGIVSKLKLDKNLGLDPYPPRVVTTISKQLWETSKAYVKEFLKVRMVCLNLMFAKKLKESAKINSTPTALSTIRRENSKGKWKSPLDGEYV